MLWTTHVLTGAAWGRRCRRPLTAALMGFCAHLFLDLVPHYDQKTDPAYIADALAGVIALYLLGPAGPLRKRTDSPLMFWGGLGAALPDIEFFVALVFHIDHDRLLFPTHNGLLPQPQIDPVFSFIMQSALVALSFLAKKERREGTS